MSERTPDPDDRPEAPAFVSHVEGSLEMPEYPTPEEMAAAFGGPVQVPTWWPAGEEPKYGVDFPHPGSTDQTRSYRTWWRSDDHLLRGLIIGSPARYRQEAGVGGWVAVPELASMRGIADRDGGTVLLDVAGHSLMFIMFPSFEDAVATAASLRRVDPAP